MALYFAQFADEESRNEQRRVLEVLDTCWAYLDRSGSLGRPRDLLRSIDDRLGLEPWKGAFDWVVTYESVEARGLAELAVQRAGALRVVAGRPARGLEETLQSFLEQAGRDLSHARVRVGFTRGHLLEVVVGLPSPAGVNDEDPQVLAEGLVDALLGDAVVDDWVAAVGSVALPRPGLLRVIQPDEDATGMHPLAELGLLVQRARTMVDDLLPDSPYCDAPVGADWAWLEMEPDPGGPQADRLAAATWLPELIKSALEGLPFHSRRFSKVGERFLWIQVPALTSGDRLGRRENIEKALDGALRDGSHGTVIGTGFGHEHDYFDLCVGPADSALGALVDAARRLELEPGAQLGFYDSRWAEERVPLASR